VRSQWISRIVPALIVSGVLALSYVIPVPASFSGGGGLASASAVGYGNNGNNCGRFGYGTHDHGKLCKHPHPPGLSKKG